MLVDDVHIKLRGGHGGKGAIAFNKVRLVQGPAGGNGGNGGTVWFEGVSDIGALTYFTRLRSLAAEDGHDGRGNFLDGRDGNDMVLKIPVGTRIIRQSDGSIEEMLEVGQQIRAVSGGLGGKGNFLFRNSVNTTPYKAQDGLPGEEDEFELELRLIADVGLVGLPNAGKSSLLNELTAAQSKVGNYAFTTLEANLGSYYGLIIADIPGLIEGASQGKGLGIKFLKHIERTRVLFHLVSAESDDPLRDYQTIRRELGEYDPALLAKKEYVFLTKSDTVSRETIDDNLAAFKKANVDAVPLSLLEDESMRQLRSVLNTIKDA
ncbi:GTPase ObgE [Candidatus Kaiserbacteria bacterium]|nr:GTPase ObgE [Candidatus Kaiserbacteria bacterium]